VRISAGSPIALRECAIMTMYAHMRAFIAFLLADVTGSLKKAWSNARDDVTESSFAKFAEETDVYGRKNSVTFTADRRRARE